MKYLLITIILLASFNSYAEYMSFKIISKQPLKHLEDKKKEQFVEDYQIVVDLDAKIINLRTPEFEIFNATNVEYSKEKEGAYICLKYKDKKQEKFMTILFPEHENDDICIIITDKEGNGWFYYCTLI